MVCLKEMVIFMDIYSMYGRMVMIWCDYSCKRICIKFLFLICILFWVVYYLKNFIVYMYMYVYVLNIGWKFK